MFAVVIPVVAAYTVGSVIPALVVGVIATASMVLATWLCLRRAAAQENSASAP